MRRLTTSMLLIGLVACSKEPQRKPALASPNTAELPAAPAMQSRASGKVAAEMKMIPIPKDKAQLARLISIGYTVHENHLHPPGVNSCPFDKNGASVIE